MFPVTPGRPPALLLAALLAAGLPASARADGNPPAPGEAARPVDPRTVSIGARVPDVPVALADGSATSLSALAKGRAALLVLIHAPDCPVSKRYGPEVARLRGEYGERGVATVVVNGGPPAAAAALAGAAAAHGWDAPLVPDGAALRAALGARSTAEAFVLDRSLTLRYRGAVDDRYGIGYARDAAREPWLRRALDGVLAGRRPSVEATTAPGCVLDGGDAPPPARAAPTWHGEVSRIVQRNCVPCHRPGQGAPFPLRTLEEVKDHGPMVRHMVEHRAMPPWFAGPGSLPFATDTSLSDGDRATLLAWVDGGMAAGDPALAPAEERHADGWTIGTPDLVLRVGTPQKVPAEGVQRYRHLRVATGLAEDRWVRAMEVRVTAPRVVHHVLVFAKFPPDHPRAWEQRDYMGGLQGFFMAMVPGKGDVTFPEGQAKFLPAGATLVFQVHYTPDGTPAEDVPSIGFVFADGPPAREVLTQGIFDLQFTIPPGAPRHEVSAEWKFLEPGLVLSFVPHMHLRGAAFRYELLLPGREPRVVLDVPRYDFDWQLDYRLREPLAVPAGARLRATGWFDNSAGNASNPDPAATVRFGEQTWEEMMIGYFDWVPTGGEPR